jgi:hypothetical protein
MDSRGKMRKWLLVVAIVGVLITSAIISMPVQAAGSNEIQKGETNSYWVAPVGCLTVYYYPNGNSPSNLEAKIIFWAHWIYDQPRVSVDIYGSTGLPGSRWYWLSRIDAQPWGCSSPPLLLNRGVYKFEIRTSNTALVGLRVRVPNKELSADLNCDGNVNLADHAILMSFWEKDPSGADSCQSPDINQDGKVNLADQSIMMSQWTDE